MLFNVFEIPVFSLILYLEYINKSDIMKAEMAVEEK
jgi:hypothetical protein